MNQRDAQKLATRRALSAAAIRLFTERGYDQTRAGDIAAEVGVSERTFFAHFPAKELSVFPDHLERVELLSAVLAELPAGIDPFDVLLDQVRFGLRATIESPVRAERYRLIAGIEALRQRDVINDLDYEDVLSDFLAQRWRVSPSERSDHAAVAFCARVLAATALATSRAALTAWARDPHFDPIPTVTEALEHLRPWPASRKDPLARDLPR